jgi:periplasmic protein TonB
LVSFVISKTGEITNVKAANKTHPILEAEAIRIIKLLPRMTPGKQKGEPVNVAYTIPINFKLQ